MDRENWADLPARSGTRFILCSIDMSIEIQKLMYHLIRTRLMKILGCPRGPAPRIDTEEHPFSMVCLYLRALNITRTDQPSMTAYVLQARRNMKLSPMPLTSVTNGLPSLNQSNRLIRNHLHSAQRVRLQFHDCLFKSRAFRSGRTRALTRRPLSGIIGSLSRGGGDGSGAGGWFGGWD